MSDEQAAEAFKALGNAYFNATNSLLAAKGENLQVFMPYKPLIVDDKANELLAKYMDGIPKKALYAGPDDTGGPIKPPRPAFEPDAAAAVKPALTTGHKSAYEAMLMNCKPSSSGGDPFLAALGGRDSQDWKDWIAYKRSYFEDLRKKGGTIDLATAQDKCFEEWIVESYSGGSPGDIRDAYYESTRTVYGKANTLLSSFDDSVTDYSEFYLWSYKEIEAAVAQGQAGSVAFESSSESTDTTHTWAGGEAGCVFDIFAIGGSAHYDHLTQEISKSNISLKLEIGSYAGFDVATNRSSWYYDPIVVEARGNPNMFSSNTNKSPQDMYNESFGDGSNNLSIGTMVFSTGQMIVGRDITCTITIDIGLGTEDATTIEAKAEGGIWPFFEASAEGGYTKTKTTVTGTSVTFVTKTNSPDQLWVLGRKVLNVFN